MIILDQISRVFHNIKGSPKQALFPVSLKIHKREIFGLLGPNGAGKTTLLRILATVIKPTNGTAPLNNFDILSAPESVKKSISFLSGNTKLYGRLTSREILTYFGKLYDLSETSIHTRIAKVSSILDIGDILDQRIDKLSTGQAQRISIARCILHDPPIYILDEPTL